MKLSLFPVSNQSSERNRSVTWMPGTRWPMLLAVGLAGALSLAGETPPPPDGLVSVAGGPYKPLYSSKASERKTEAFFLGITPVTNGEFLEFVRMHPEWRRSRVKREMADENYLKHWADDLDLGKSADQLTNAPVIHVSWFAARAYCLAKGLRLPTQDEWEFAARADKLRPDASRDNSFQNKVLEWYAKPSTALLPPVTGYEANLYGAKGMHGYIWEWVYDFNSSMVTGDARGDNSLERNLFCGAGALSSSDTGNYAGYMRYAFRSSLKGNYCLGTLGFRTARSIDPTKDASLGVLALTPWDFPGFWLNQHNRELKLSDLKGKPRVFTMGYTSCEYICGRMVSDMAAVETALGADADQVGFVFLSIDPARDVPAKTKTWADKLKLDSSRWDVLTGDKDAVRELAVILNYKYEQIDEAFMHSNVIFVMDAQGRIAHRADGFGADIPALTKAVQETLEKNR